MVWILSLAFRIHNNKTQNAEPYIVAQNYNVLTHEHSKTITH